MFVEKEIKVYGSIEDAVTKLLEAKEKGENVFCLFQGKVLHSYNVTMDSAYLKILGCTKEEFDKRLEEGKKISELKEREAKNRKKRYAAKLEANRFLKVNPVTYENVTAGLKFIAENQNLNHDEFMDGLLALGCNFTIEEIDAQFKDKKQIFYNVTAEELAEFATIIACCRDSEINRSYNEDALLTFDDNYSIYYYVRLLTGEETYTKENVEQSNKAYKKIL